MEVLYPHYREYLQVRAEANNAIIALLAGSRLASHTLQLTTGSTRLLPEIFPAVEHIQRFNLRTDLATDLLLHADRHLGAVTVPYALALCEDFVKSSIEWMRSCGIAIGKSQASIVMANMNETLFTAAKAPLDADLTDQFHVLRTMRNCQIHSAGRVSSALKSAVDALSPTAKADWQRRTGEPVVESIEGNEVSFTVGHIFAAFAIAKAIGRRVNFALQTAIPRSTWIAVATRDYADNSRKPKNSNQWLRALPGYVRQYYAPLNLNASELGVSAVQLQLWQRSS